MRCKFINGHKDSEIGEMPVHLLREMAAHATFGIDTANWILEFVEDGTITKPKISWDVRDDRIKLRLPSHLYSWSGYRPALGKRTAAQYPTFTLQTRGELIVFFLAWVSFALNWSAKNKTPNPTKHKIATFAIRQVNRFLAHYGQPTYEKVKQANPFKDRPKRPKLPPPPTDSIRTARRVRI